MTENGKAIIKYERSLQAAVQTRANLELLLQSFADRFMRSVPEWSGVSGKQLIESALMNADHGVLGCSANSIVAAVATGCELGLSFSRVLGQAYLVPFRSKNKPLPDATLIIGYKGFLLLVRRAANAKSIDGDVVYAGEQFEAVKGTSPRLTHVLDPTKDRETADIIAAYAVAFFADAPPAFELMTRNEIDAIRAMSKKESGDIWRQHFAAMARKTVLRRFAKYLPISPDRQDLLEKAFGYDNATAGIATPTIPADEPKRLDDLRARLQGNTDAPLQAPPPLEEAPARNLDVAIDALVKRAGNPPVMKDDRAMIREEALRGRNEAQAMTWLEGQTLRPILMDDGSIDRFELLSDGKDEQ